MKQKMGWIVAAALGVALLFPSVIGRTAGKIVGHYDAARGEVAADTYRKRNAGF